MKHSVSSRGASALALLAALAGFIGTQAAEAQTYSSLMYFNGSRPAGSVTLGTDGALYGVATESQLGSGAIAGLIYRVTADATQVTTTYQFGRLGNFTGGGPRGTLATDGSGTYYGVTAYSLIDSFLGFVGNGTLFKMTQNGTYTRIYSFSDFTTTSAPLLNADGAAPNASLLLASDGFLYGTTFVGGANGTGTIFKIATDGTGFTVLHSFAAATGENSDARAINADGLQTQSRLMLASNGDLYGTTTGGGTNGTGVIYRLHRDGTGFTVLMHFDASPVIDTSTGAIKTNTSGGYPAAGLLQASNGLLYSTTNQLGANGYGNIYNIAMDGSGFTVLKVLDVDTGAFPLGELIVANDGMIVGTTSGGATQANGAPGGGTIFSMSLDATTFNTLFVFGNEGAVPTSGVVQTADGSFYGTTSQGGAYGLGTVFKFGDPTNRAPLGTPEPYDDGSGSLEWWVIGVFALLLGARFAKRESVRA